MLAEENIEEYVSVPRPREASDGEYLLRVRGESMKKVGIIEGDLVVVRPQDTAHDGDIVVALVGEEATVKRYFREADHVRLQPENDEMEPIRSPRGPRARPRRRPDALDVATRAVGAPPCGGCTAGHALLVDGQAEQPRRFAFEESPDITGQGGR